MQCCLSTEDVIVCLIKNVSAHVYYGLFVAALRLVLISLNSDKSLD
jgi:hypothetical protein